MIIKKLIHWKIVRYLIIKTLDKKLSNILQNSQKFEIIDYDYDKCILTLLGELGNYKNFNNLDNSNTKITENFILRIKKREFEILNLKADADQQEYKAIMKSLISNINNSSNIVFNNDIYYKLLAKSESENGLKIDFIYPADKKVIDKYKQKKYIFFTESYDTYLNKTKKYIDSIDPGHTKWIENALYKNTEPILFQIPNEFVIIKDYNTVDNKNILNCLGLPFQKIKCLRDIDSSHIPLLEKFYYEGVINFKFSYFILLYLNKSF